MPHSLRRAVTLSSSLASSLARAFSLSSAAVSVCIRTVEDR